MRISPKLVSRLGSPDSKIPLAVKDIFNTAGYTYFSYDAGGSVEGKDRLADELSTGAVWLFGIPAYKKLIDKTLYKAAKIPSEVDVRVIKDKNCLEEAVKQAPSEKIAQELLSAAKSPAKTKMLAIAKFAIAMGLTMLSYAALTNLKQRMTRNNIEKEFKQKMLESFDEQEPEIKTAGRKTQNFSSAEKCPDVFKSFNNFNALSGSKAPSFGSAPLLGAAEEFILNPVKNMLILDLGISGTRLKNARTDGEFKEYAVKEGSFLFFVYAADKYIRQGIEFISKKFFKIPIALDAQFLASEAADKMLKDKETQKQAEYFIKKAGKKNASGTLYKFILNNQDNAAVKAAQQSGLIETVKDAAGNIKIDTRRYIDEKKMKKFAADLQDFISSGESAKNLKKYLNTARGLKVASAVISIGASCLSLGYITPKLIYKYRHKTQNGNTDFHVRTQYEKELAEKYKKQNAA